MNTIPDKQSSPNSNQPPSPKIGKWLLWGSLAFALLVTLMVLKGGSKPPVLPPSPDDTTYEPTIAATEIPPVSDWYLDDGGDSDPQPASQNTMIAKEASEPTPPLDDPIPVATPKKEESAALKTSSGLVSKEPSKPPVTSQTPPVPQAAKPLKPRKEVVGIEFVEPVRKTSGVVSHSKSLLEEKQVRQILPAPAGTVSAAPVLSPKQRPAPAMVQKSEATEFVNKLDKKLKEEGTIANTEQVRLPKTSETRNVRVWREEDVPKEPTERRPIGVVIAETASDINGFPVRANIPVGRSPLEKTGPDAPLWKRP